MPPDHDIRITLPAPAPDIDLAVVDAGLGDFNDGQPALRDVRPLHAVAHAGDGSVVGGAVGRTWGGCCELQKLWVAAEHRGRGMGSRLLEAFEREAVSRGCTLAYLDTFSFQAPAFYAARGYVEVLRVTGFTGGVTKMTLHKPLAPGASGHAAT